MKPHGHNPKARREARDRRLRLERAERIVARRTRAPAGEDGPAPVGRCEERNRSGHRCRARGRHDIHRAFGREWMRREKLKDGPQRKFTPGWSRRGQLTRTEMVARALVEVWGKAV